MNSSDAHSRREFGRQVLTLVLTGGGLASLLHIDNATAQQRLTIDLQDAAYSALNTVGGAVRVTPPGTFDPVIVVRVSDSEFAAYSSTCPHRSCPVDLPDENGIVLCPCHDSHFDIRGRYIDGPARADLPPVEFEILQATAVAPATWGHLKRESGQPGH